MTAPPRPWRGADLVILSVPVGACGPLAAEIAPHLQPGAILTDVGSVKAAVVRDMAPHVPEGVHFVPGHPIAGTEQSGPEAGFAELFEGRWTILTPRARHRCGSGRQAQGILDGAGLQGRDHERAAPRHGAGDHQPRAASHRLQHRQHGRAPGTRHRQGGHQVLRRRLPRFHAHRRVRSDHVARRVPQQQGSGDGDAAPLLRRPRRAAHAPSKAPTATRCSGGSRGARTVRRGIIAAGQDTSAPDFGRTPAGQPDPAASKSGTRK